MGLSGRKAKQRIGKDPRNLSWADDASRFGQAYLEKFGWDASKGLGASGDGRTNAIKASQKLDMLGIGMRHQKDVDGGIAWRQNRDFEDLLRRLNEGPEATNATGPLPLPFHKARESESLEGEVKKAASERGNVEKVKDEDGDEDQEGVATKKEKRKKKKKRKATEEEEEDIDRKERKKKKRKKSSSCKDGGDDERAMPSGTASELPLPSRPHPCEARPAHESASAPIANTTATDTATSIPAPIPVRAPPRTHRARFIAAKRMAASNSTALAEILGIPSSSSSSVYPSAVASPVPGVPDPQAAPALATPATEAQDPQQRLTTSSQSVGDYFKAKLGAKAHGERQACPTSAPVGPPASSAGGDDNDDRAGLGLGKGLPRVPPQDEEPVRGGIGASSSRFMTMFMPAQPTTKPREAIAAMAGIEPVVTHDAADHDNSLRKSKKRRAKEERRRAKEERRRKRTGAGQVDRVMADVPVDGAPTTGTKKMLREPGAPDGWSDDSPPSGASGGESMEIKKRKKRDKDRKSAKHRKHKE